MGAGQRGMSDPRARQMAARGEAAQAAPQGSVPSLGVPGGTTPGDAFARMMNSRPGTR